MDMATIDTAPVDITLEDLRRQIRFPSWRAWSAVISCLGFVNMYALRSNLSVAMVAMVNNSYSHPSRSHDRDCPGANIHNMTENSDGEFNWDNSLQGYILGSFYGYLIMQIPGGWLAERYGAKQLLGVGVLITAVLTLLTPLAARTSPYFLIALRVIEGIGEGVTFPAMNALLSHWAPPLERSKITTFVHAGCQFGTVLSLPLSGIVSDQLGWPWAFYVTGALGCIWFVFYEFLVFESPAKHPRISEHERAYLEKAMGPHNPACVSVPWISIFTSVPFWAMAVAHVCFNWGFYTLLTSLPKYFDEVLHYHITANSFFSTLPYVVQWLFIVLGGQVADALIKREVLGRTAVRKLMNTTGMLCSAGCLLVTSYQGCNPATAVLLLVVGSGLGAVACAGFLVNHLNLAPQYAGTMMGITNALATIPGFLSPQVVGWFTEYEASVATWKNVFFLSSGIYIFGALAFLIFSSGKKQPWASNQNNIPATSTSTIFSVQTV